MEIIHWKTSGAKTAEESRYNFNNNIDCTYHGLIKVNDDAIINVKYNNIRVSCSSLEEYANTMSSIIKDIILDKGEYITEKLYYTDGN